MILKNLLILILLLVLGLTACKNSNVNSLDAGATPQSDTISYASDTLKEVKQYDAQGRRTGFWTYEEYGWVKNEHYADGVLDGHATYTDDERINQNERMRIEMDYCNGVECGEMKIFFEGRPGLHLTNITKVDTVIEEFQLDYRAHIKEYLRDGKTLRCEGVGYYGNSDFLIAEGYWCVGRWKIYDTKSKTVKTVTFKKPTCALEIGSYIQSLGI
ncbi:MAG: hypothetical protein II899_02140 [Bacteroidales bacterium]|nr:hypothetical protein [Bacteroidales bacterium]